MTDLEKADLVDSLISQEKKNDDFLDKVGKVFGEIVDSEIFDLFCDNSLFMSKLVSKIIDDKSEWVEWYSQEWSTFKDKSRVQAVIAGKEYRCYGAIDLINIINADNENMEKTNNIK